MRMRQIGSTLGVMTVTLRDLLHAPELGLAPLVVAHSVTNSDLVPVDWVHHSDLGDPTPFVAENQVLLITRPRRVHTAAEYDGYVERLAKVGVVAVGFGVGVFSAATPPELIAACQEHELRLFEVPFATPFIAVSRFVAGRQAQLAQARDAQTLSALNGLSSAALRKNAVPSLLGELAKRVHSDVLLTDNQGTVTATAGNPPSPELELRISTEANRLGSRGQRATSSLVDSGAYVSLQTVGPGEGMRGILVVVGPSPPSASDHAVATSAVALLALLLAHKRSSRTGHIQLRARALELLLEGHTEITHRVLTSVGEELPKEPIVVATFIGSTPANSHPWSTAFIAEHDDFQVAILAADAPTRKQALSLRVDHPGIGLSMPSSYAQLPMALNQALMAQRGTNDDEPVRQWSHQRYAGLEWIHQLPQAQQQARATMAPLLGRDCTELLESLRVWLGATGAWDAAARELGIHRHTLRRRINTAETMLGRDLSQMNARTEIWLALQTLEVTS